ncbi:UDP-N-acetylglucosamine 2-epimerase [Gammaproteobacteria bacterium]|nr:UDP-N-acetylglucosamine 2-epimerase [Gammaproteobacteria bacterium]
MFKSKKIVFLTGTRADFGKLKSLISITQKHRSYEVHLFATGMHMNSLYGSTIDEIRKSKFDNIYPFINHDSIGNMDRTLAKTIDGFSHFVSEVQPDLIVVHGDRVEALAGAIVGSLNNILVAHVEGGEVSGTIDELIRHAVSKMSHVHLVANKLAKRRLLQLGELPSSTHIIGSPDLDLMNPKLLPSLDSAMQYYGIEFESYSIAMYHPVTTSYKVVSQHVKDFVSALLDSNDNFIVVYPNNDLGSFEILKEYDRLKNHQRFKVFPSLRFEYFLALLKNANYLIGNSSAGIREAPYYNTPSIDIGSRQMNRSSGPSIFNASDDYESIMKSMKLSKEFNSNATKRKSDFGQGGSDIKFLNLLNSNKIWSLDCQKQFQDLNYE